MSETDRHDALGLAELLIEYIDGPAFHVPHYVVRDTAKELRRLHEENQNMRMVNNFLRNRRGKSNYHQTVAAEELRSLHAENSALAAGQCTEGGPWGDEGGTPYCKLKEVNRELVEALVKLCDYANDSNDCQYGTLSTSLVLDIAEAALAKAKGEIK